MKSDQPHHQQHTVSIISSSNVINSPQHSRTVLNERTQDDDPNRDTFNEPWPDLVGFLRKKFTCNRDDLVHRLPIIGWARSYRWSYAYQDFIAGITVGLTAVPQGIAYAVVAGLEPQYGLYAELLGSFIYCVLGSSRNVTIGPTAIMALLVHPYATQSADLAVLSAFISGIIITCMGLLDLGFLVQFISLPVTVGFTTAAALSIGSLQVKSLLGLPGGATEFIEAWRHIFDTIGHTKLWDCVLGCSSIVVLIALKYVKVRGDRYRVAVKLLSLCRNALVIAFGTVLAYALSGGGESPAPFALTGPIQAGFPPIGLPAFSTTTISNVTLDFADMTQVLGTSLLSIPMIAILEIVAVGKAFATVGRSLDATQEMIALGSCNILGSLVRSFPVTGSFTRTAVNEASGVRTPFGGIATGILVLLSVGFLTETFQFIPKTSLAAVIITAMIFMVEVKNIAAIWRTRRIDMLPFFVTFIGCLSISLDAGIICGVAVNLLFILWDAARPACKIDLLLEYSDDQPWSFVVNVRPEQSLTFAAAENLKHRIMKSVSECQLKVEMKTSDHIDESTIPLTSRGLLVINGEHVRHIDVTVAKCFRALVEDLRQRRVSVIFWNWQSQPVAMAWRLAGEQFGRLFQHGAANVEAAIMATANDTIFVS